jgi:arylsulfatase A
MIEGMWALSTIGVVRPELVAMLAGSADHHVRAAAIRQLKFWQDSLPDRHEILARAAADPAGLVRLEAAIAASWIGTPEALLSLEAILRQPLGGHLAYAAACAARSAAMARLWQADPASPIPALLKRLGKATAIKVPKPSKAEATFDARQGLAAVEISCQPERMLFTQDAFTVQPGQPVKLVFTNPDATDHNLVIVKPGALAEVGIAANEMARDPTNAAGDFIPESKRDTIVAATPMIGPTRKALAHVLRFEAPTEPGVYPYVCTFPGHWIVMNGRMVVADDAAEAERLLAECRPKVVRAWTTDDFETLTVPTDPAAVERGFHAFVKAQCSQCHVAAGHGVNLGPNLVETVKKRRGRELLEHILEPSREIAAGYRSVQFVLESGRVVSGVVTGETDDSLRVTPNLLVPESVITIPRAHVDERIDSRVSPMPAGLVNVLEREEILDLLAFLEAGENLPAGLRHEAHGGPADAAAASKPAPEAAPPASPSASSSTAAPSADDAAAAEPPSATSAPSARATPSSARPNVVLFLADDLGYGELGCYGNAAAVTPNLDRFAAEGLRFTDCHSASSVCSPSRSSLLTGRTPFRNGVFTWIPENSPIHLRTSEITLPTLLRQAGYDTCNVGKWHLNGKFNSPEQPQPDAHGYGWWLATQNNAAPSHAFPTNFVRNGEAIGKVDDYSAPFIAGEAVTWLKEKRDTTKPFFLAVWTHEPHYPIASAERYQELHGTIADPEERTYRANVTQLDDAFGTVMKALDDMGVADKTLVFFTSDNGPEGAGNKGPGRGLAGNLRGRKRSMYEGGHRVPGIVRWPGKIEPGSTSDVTVIGSDFFPTVLAATGVEPPPGVTLDGANLLPALAGGPIDRPVPLYWRWDGKVAWREANWKIVVDEKLTKPELYDLSADVAETTNLAAREPERLSAMMRRLAAYQAEVEAEGPTWPVGARPKRKPKPAAGGPQRPKGAASPARP